MSAAEPQAWSQVHLTNGTERVFVMLTSNSEKAFYGVPLNERDSRVVWPKPEWKVAT